MTFIEKPLDEGRLELVKADTNAATTKLEEAKRHLQSAAAIADSDAEGAYSLLYDAARKAIDAHMLAHGYRASKKKLGAHEATARYAAATIGGDYAADASALDRMRKKRNRTEYDSWHISETTLEGDLAHARRLVSAVAETLAGIS